MITAAFLIAAAVIFIIDAARSKSLLSAGLACACASALALMGGA